MQPRSNQGVIEDIARRANAPVPDAAEFGQAFGADFESVRALLGGPEAESALDAIGANAATVGDRIVFRDAQPAPDLVGHELAHTVQQGAVHGGREGGGGSAEDEARRAGALAARGQPASVAASAQQGSAQYDLRGSVAEQRDARGTDTPSTAPGGTYASFVDHDDQAPVIRHDHGFLDDGSGNIDESKREDPTWSDRLARAQWVAKLELAEVLRPDLVDGTAAYRHFLEGGGAPRTVNYQRFVEGDSSGATVMASAIEDAQNAALQKHDTLVAGRPVTPGTTSFRMRTNPVGVGSDGRYPYPATENWQKALGAHSIWLDMDVTVEVYQVSRTDPPGVNPNDPPVCTPEGDTVIVYGRRFEVELTLHMEDMYNFNPGAADIATGAPDSDNGRFEITGLGHEYLNTATLERSLDFEATMDPVSTQPGANTPPAADLGRAPGTRGRPDGARRVNPGVR